MNASRPSAFKKLCAGIVAAALVMQPLGVYAAAITTSSLAEIPLQGLNPVKPNIMFTLDDSGSMGWDYLPDWTAWIQAGFSYCRDNRECGGPGGFNNIGTNVGSLPSPGVYAPYREIDPPLRSSDFNKLYYNPTAAYDAGKRADGTGLPCEGSNTGCTGPWTRVYMNGYVGYPGANTGATINLAPTSTAGCVSPATTALCVPVSAPSDDGPWPGVPDTLWCRSTGSPLTGADYLTADGDGSVCRRNGRAYPRTTIGAITTPAIAAGYNYPNGVGTTCAAGETCLFTSSVTAYGYPFYYTISNVWFCSGSAGGWGTGTCGTRQDLVTYKFVRYSASATSGAAFDPTAFKRVDITPASATGVLVNGVAAANPSGQSYAQEMTNFAKWYAFNRTRILAMKTAGGIAFSALSEENARVGFHTLWENGSATAGFLNILPFDTSQKAAWFGRFYAVAPQNGTPLPDAVFRIGEYFSNSGASGLPGAIDPLDATTGRCQSNYHLLSTDGYWNYRLGEATTTTPPTGASINPTNQDRTVPALANLPGNTGFTPNAAFPRPYYEGPTASDNTLADLAMKYWINDIRPDLVDSVKDSVAPWQHVSLYGLSIGAQGNVVYPTGIDAINAGTANWPTPTGAGGVGGPDSIDDLWHAAVNSRGKFFNATNPQQLAESIVNALTDFTSVQSGTGTAVGIAGAQFSATKKYGYRTSYEAGWWGDVKKYLLDPSTGALPVDSAGNPKNAPIWSAATQLDALAAGTGWDANRRILTMKDNNSNKAIPFRLKDLAKSQTDSLANAWSTVSSPPTAQQVLNFLRGDKSNEGTGTTNFRIRSHILGDVVYSGAVPVGAPIQPYDDAGNPGYTAFAAAKQSRTPIVYVGGNDGMLHAFDDSNTANAGNESWAYVPKALFNADDPNRTGQFPPTAFQLGALSYRVGGIPLFSHKFYVNATPRVWDIDFANANLGKNDQPPKTGNDWHTILVGGLGAGARSVYALDVTTPVAPTETEADIVSSKRVLWEFTDDHLGYVFDAPTLVKTKRYGWVVLVASGYNNPDGDGKLFVINPTDGKLLQTLSTGVGSDDDPSGLSTIRAYTPSRKDPYVLQAYGGDLKGNVWRFDLSDPDETNWKVELIAKLAGANGKAQPITTGVRIEIDQNNNVDRYLFVGTGQLLDQKDLGDNSVTNTLYVIRDGTRTAAEPAPKTPYSRANLNTVVAGQVAGFTGPPTGRGWYQDATDPKEKIGTDVFADVQTVVYSFSKPANDPCEAALTSNLFARDLNTGNSVLQSAGGDVVSSITDIGAIAGVALIQGQAGTGASASGDVRAQVTTMKGQVFSFGVKLTGAASNKHRVSWRLLNRE